MICHINSCQLFSWMTNLEKNSKVECNHFMINRIDKSNQICMICLSLKRSKIFEEKVFLKNHFMVILININIYGILTFNITRYRINSIFILISISIESDLLSNRNSNSKVLSCLSLKLEEILVITYISITKSIPLVVELVCLFIGLFAWSSKLLFNLLFLTFVFLFISFLSFMLFGHYLIIVFTRITC